MVLKASLGCSLESLEEFSPSERGKDWKLMDWWLNVDRFGKQAESGWWGVNWASREWICTLEKNMNTWNHVFFCTDLFAGTRQGSDFLNLCMLPVCWTLLQLGLGRRIFKTSKPQPSKPSGRKRSSTSDLGKDDSGRGEWKVPMKAWVFFTHF